MSEISRNPLSCTRCKVKKIKCGREEPKCDKCRASRADCSYPTRRQKSKTAKKRTNILSEILSRLDTLEKKVGVSPRQPRTAQDENSHDGRTGSLFDEDDDEGATESDATHTDNDTPFKSLYQLMNEAATTTKTVLEDVPEDTPPDQVANSLFDDALNSIRTFRWVDEKSKNISSDLGLAAEQARKWVDLCFQVTFYEQIIGLSNKSLMMAMPDILKTPVVEVRYCVIILYYIVLFYGWREDKDSSLPQWKSFGRKVYRKCLTLLQAWKNDGLPSTVMDCIGTSLMCLMAIENFDYHLGWDLHLASVAIARELKLDKLDDINPENRPSGYEDEDERNAMRKKIWQIIHLEFFFRLYYDKPPTLTATDFSVNLPSIAIEPGFQHTADTIYFLVSSRHVFITKEFFDILQKPGDDLKTRVDVLTNQMEDLMVEWNLDGLLANPEMDLSDRCMMADSIMNGYITIILMEKKAFGSKNKTDIPSLKSVRAARKVLQTIHTLTSLFGNKSPNFLNFVSFYPFVAFFTLYHHIIFALHQRQRKEDVQLEEIESDINLLEKLAGAMANLATIQEEFAVVANAVATLTKTCHQMLSTSTPITPASDIRTPTGTQTLRRTPRLSRAEPPKSQPDPSLLWTDTYGTIWPQLTAGFPRDDFQAPLMYVESMESDLFGKNWHQSWWDP